MSSTGLGLRLSAKIKQKENICRELSELCDEITLDLSYKITPISSLLESKLKSKCNLDFINFDNVKNELLIDSPLSIEENREIGSFLYSLGKSDVTTQIKLISGFKQYIDYSKNQYQDQYKRTSKVYIGYGAFFGVLVILILM